jgi:hypothetical protein
MNLGHGNHPISVLVTSRETGRRIQFVIARHISVNSIHSAISYFPEKSVFRCGSFGPPNTVDERSDQEAEWLDQEADRFGYETLRSDHEAKRFDRQGS